jgi:hypothetical protein
MRKWIALSSAVAATGVVAILPGRVYSAQAMKPVPVTIVSKIDSYLSGKYIRTRTKITAARSDGSQVEVLSVTSPDGVFFDNREIFDWPAQRRIAVYNVAKSKNTADVDPREFAARRNARVACGSDPTRERSTYRGYEVVKDTVQYGNHDQTRESWLVPALNCLELLGVTTRSEDGQQVVVTRTETLLVSLGEPDPTLFEVPEDYVERPVRDILRETERALGLPPRPLPHLQSR